MKLIIEAGRILAEATDDYAGPMEWIEAPEGFDAARMSDYVVANGEAVLPESVTDMRITKLAFRNRFTMHEKASIEFAALDDPAADIPQRMQSAALRAYIKDTEAATFIDLVREDLAEGVNSLETGGIIAVGRAAEILSQDIADLERYKG